MDRLQPGQAVAAQFELSDSQVQKCFDHFVQELSMLACEI